ncbi:D-lactate dehydrogenase [Coprinopsis sp. MPI-PUGE-AT-0042]|nr:D-lactate dehydrogenase [Coprinopsis sp. MPI-PUGE-AT-0042]
MKVAVFSTRKYDREYLNAANNDDFLSFTFIEAFLTEDTVSLASDHEAVCLFVNDTCNASIIEKLQQLGIKYIALRAAGVTNVDLAAEKNGIPVASVPAYSPEAVAEYAVGLLMLLVRKYHKANNRVREGNFLLDGLVGFNVSSKTVGIVGTGKIGALTARILSKGFGAKVLAFDPMKDDDAAKESGFEYVSLDELLEKSEIISLHCPLSDKNKHMINDETIGKMKKELLLNTSRGGLVDTQALIRAEYFFQDSSEKVMTDDVMARLLSFYNVAMTGHQAFLTEEALENIAETTFNNLKQLKEKGTCDCLAA